MLRWLDLMLLWRSAMCHPVQRGRGPLVTVKAGVMRRGGMRWGGWTHQLVGSPCVAGHPARSCPLAGLLDCTLLLDSLKDQEENLIVVKTWTWKREGEGKEERTHQTISNCPSSSPNILLDIVLVDCMQTCMWGSPHMQARPHACVHGISVIQSHIHWK